MKQSIIWTALPNGVRREANGEPWLASVSVFVTPRLAPDDGNGTLADFDTWRDWPAALRAMDSAGELFEILMHDQSSVPRQSVIAARSLPESDAWQALLPASTPVRTFDSHAPQARSVGSGDIRTYNASGLVGMVRNAYAQAFAQDQQRSAKTSSDPLRAFRNAKPGGPLMSNASAIHEFVAFHDALERKGGKNVPDDLLTDCPDFHQKISTLSAHPALLRQLGLIIDLDIPVDALGLTDGLDDMRLKVTPRNLPAAIESHSFWTAAEYASAGTQRYRVFATRDQHQSQTFGFYALNRQPMTLVQEQFEHATVSLIQHATGGQSANALPRLQQGGMRILDPTIPARVRTAVRDQRELEQTLRSPLKTSANETPTDEQTLYAEQLTRGYRIDVNDVAAGNWRSLCERSTHYTTTNWSWPGGDQRFFDEGAVEFTGFESRTALTPDMHVLEDLFNWDGWSLAVPRPDVDEAQHDTCDDAAQIDIDLQVRPGSLQPQRFGRCYQFRARRVDIAGNSVSVDDALQLGDQLPMQLLATRPTCCLRVESALPPNLFPAQARGVGEEGDMLVIRDAEDPRYQTRQFRAHIFPPQTSVEMAERHGVFDGLSAKDSWQVIERHRGSLDTDDDGNARTMIPHGFVACPYLPDPIVAQAVMTLPDGSAPLILPRFDDLSGARGKSALARSCLLTIRPGNNEIVSTIRGHSVTLQVPIGRVQKVRIASRPSDNSLEQMALLHDDWNDQRNISDDAKRSLKAAAMNGQAAMLAPDRTIEIVHACQRPLITPVFDQPRLLARRKDETHAVFVDERLHFDVPSTGRLDLYATWDDTTDDPAQSGWQTNSHELHAGGVDVGDDDTHPFTATPSENGRALPLTHDFGDTKHHAVRYRTSAITRFMALYPAELSSDPDNMNRMSSEFLLHVPSTAAPDVPGVAHILPTFRHQTEKQNARLTTAEQQGDGLRIYLQRGWFSSGDGEQLALVMATAGLPETRRDEACDWGVNTLRDSADLPGPLTADLLTSGIAHADPDGIVEQGLVLKLHDVQFSREHQLPFVDIVFSPSMSFMPLVRLVLARYQPHAIDGCHLSPTVQTDFVPLAPGRALSIEKKSANEWALAVRGYSYRAAEKHQYGQTSVMLAHVEVLSVNTPTEDAVWETIDTAVTLKPASLSDYDYQWNGSVRVDPAQWPHRQWRRRLVIREYEPLTLDRIDDSVLADHARVISAHSVEL